MNESGGVAAVRFLVLGIDAGIADVGVGQRDDLAAIRGISEDLLVARHRGVEDHLAGR